MNVFATSSHRICRICGLDGADSEVVGYVGLGGSFALYDSKSGVAIGVTVNKLTTERAFSSAVANLVAQQTGIASSITL